ncbi:hypothetical protein VHEMI07789 [[Torrubiella] hemipterigena]|uniref:Major facilitator superfamily (MFS) profile domain-containing protein n=2 Tax=[Torrubiella] hemipterigena TaxID=1531966 RepID=A0A0A1TNK9_9HYPO|nr:hypothetical protein VHEMI07789 [[Torrubiella] hemipterigena]
MGGEKETEENSGHPTFPNVASLPPQPTDDATGELAKTTATSGQQNVRSSTDGTEAPDPNEVDWDGPDDPHNPRNWPVWRRAMVVGLITAVVFSTNIAAVAIAPAIPLVMAEFGSKNQELGILAVTIELLGTGVGPVFMAPMSELFGRRATYNCANLAFCGFTIGCALAPNLPGLIVLRFLQGCAASCNLNNAGGTIADLVSTRHRGFAMSMYSAGFMLSPVIGPLVGSYLSAAAGWRWVFWLLSILSGTLGIICAVTYGETYGPVLLERKAKKLRKSTGNPALYAKGQRKLSPAALFKRATSRPFKILFFCPVVTGLAVYNAVVYGTTYLLLSTFSDVFQTQYHYNQSNLGLTYIGLTLGFLFSLIFASITNDKSYARLAKKHGVGKPEYRLEPLIYGAIAIPVGLFMYGWTTEARVHSAVPIFSTAIIGFGVMFTFIPFNVYMIDAYMEYAASAIAAGNILRSMTASLLPLTAIPLYDRLGYGWGNSVLAFISLGLGAMAILYRKYGEQWRERFRIDL